jgi:putative flippase GtrA
MSVLITNENERRRFLRFLLVGVIGFVVDVGLYNLLLVVLPADGMMIRPVVIAGAVSFAAAIVSNFYFNRYWTYPDSRSKPMAGQLAQFSTISILGLGIRTPILWLLELPLHHFFAGLPIMLGAPAIDFLAQNTDLAIAVGVVMFWNFFANRYWTYNDVKS